MGRVRPDARKRTQWEWAWSGGAASGSVLLHGFEGVREQRPRRARPLECQRPQGALVHHVWDPLAHPPAAERAVEGLGAAVAVQDVPLEPCRCRLESVGGDREQERPPDTAAALGSSDVVVLGVRHAHMRSERESRCALRKRSRQDWPNALTRGRATN
jgi:hypothetical protein